MKNTVKKTIKKSITSLQPLKPLPHTHLKPEITNKLFPEKKVKKVKTKKKKELKW